jgi:biopolymer transport protein ExbD
MAQPLFYDQNGTDDDRGPVIAHRPVRDTGELDITPMIDVTFLLLIFFLVSTTTAMQSAVDLPPARHGEGVSSRTSVVVTVAGSPGGAQAQVYLGDGTSGTPLPVDPQQQTRQIAAYVRSEHLQGKDTVLVKAGRDVRHRDVARVAEAVGEADVEVHLHLAVKEEKEYQ